MVYFTYRVKLAVILKVLRKVEKKIKILRSKNFSEGASPDQDLAVKRCCVCTKKPVSIGVAWFLLRGNNCLVVHHSNIMYL